MPRDPNRPRCGIVYKGRAPCGQDAGWGTDHKGTGACKLHGGRAGAPKGNKNALRSGLYESIIFSTLTDDEKAEFAAAEARDRLAHINQAIALATIREVRMMQRIAKLRDEAGEMSLVHRLDGDNLKLGAHWEERLAPTLDRIQAIEADLTTLQRTKAGLVKQAQEIEAARGGAGDDEPIDRLFDAMAASRRKHEGG